MAVVQISLTFEFINVQQLVGPKQLNSADAFRGVTAKAKDIVMKCGLPNKSFRKSCDYEYKTLKVLIS
jgi:hypothetical protein